MPKIKVPLLVIQGENDEYGTDAQVEAIARQAGAGVEVLLLPNCGHAPHREQEVVTLEAMTHFIKRIFDSTIRLPPPLAQGGPQAGGNPYSTIA